MSIAQVKCIPIRVIIFKESLTRLFFFERDRSMKSLIIKRGES